jgi:hypothetical protein
MKLVPSLLAGVVSGLQTETLTVLQCLSQDPEISPMVVFGRIRYEIPGSSWTEKMVRDQIARILKPVKVPTWFHEIMWLAGSIEKFIPEMEKRLTTRFPKKNHILQGLSPSFASMDAMHKIASVWYQHCVLPMQMFTEGNHCFETEVVIDGFETVGWRLSPERMQMYLSQLALEEARVVQSIADEQLEAEIDSFLKLLDSPDNRMYSNFENFPAGSGVTSSESASVAGSDSPKRSLKRKYSTSVRRIEIESLLNLMRTDPAQFMREIEIVVSGIVPGAERARERFEILEPVVQPTWFHAALMQFDRRLFNDNKILEIDLKLVGGKLFNPRFVKFIEAWSRWCIQPLQRGDMTACSPLTVHNMNRGIVHWIILSNTQILAYLERQLQQH